MSHFNSFLSYGMNALKSKSKSALLAKCFWPITIIMFYWLNQTQGQRNHSTIVYRYKHVYIYNGEFFANKCYHHNKVGTVDI